MSTRSGKRIHGSILENTVDDVAEVKSERKTRGKRLKDNYNETASEKKRKHYVRYPSEEDLAAANNADKLLRSTRKSQRNTLKELNIVTTDSEASNDDRTLRHSRRMRKTEATESTENIDPNNELKTKTKGKNNKKTKILTDENTLEPIPQTIKKKSNKRKNKRKSGSLIVEDIVPTADNKNNLSNTSIDSFHSAAGSPAKVYDDITENMLDIPSKSTRSHDKVVTANDQIEDMPLKATRSKMQSVKNITIKDAELKTTKKKDTKRKRKLTNESACNNSLTKTFNNDANNSPKVIIEPVLLTTDYNVTQDEKHTDFFNNSPGLNNSLKNSNKKRRSKINTTNDKNDHLSIFEIETVKTPDKLQKLDITKEFSPKKNSTYDKIDVSETSLNATFDKEIPNNSVNQHDQPQDVLTKGNKSSAKKKRNSTYDKIDVSEANLNVTFDKDFSNQCEDQSEKSQNDSTSINGTAKTSNRKKRNSNYDKINADTTANLNATFEKDIEREINDFDNHSRNAEDESTNINGCENSNRKRKNSTYNKINFSETSLNATFDEEMPKSPVKQLEETQIVIKNYKKNSDKKKTNTRKSISDNIDTSIINLDATYEKNDTNLMIQTAQNDTQEKQLRKSRRFSKFSLDRDESTNLNTTYDKSSITDSQPNSRNNSTFDKSAQINTTFEMVKNTCNDATDATNDATLHKSQNNDTRRGSSLISSDATDNTSSETSKDISRISITSDESMVDNIVNTTPVLIESSMDNSQINISSHEANKSTKVNADIKEIKSKTPQKNEEKVTEIKTSKTPLKREGTYTEINYATPPKGKGTFTENKGSTTPKGKESFTETKGPNTPIREGTYTELKTSTTPLKREGTYTELNPTTTPSKNLITPIKINGIVENKISTPPLKREGTFTKDESPKIQLNVSKTPTRRKSLPSPGRTPFPISKSASKEQENVEKSILNVTRSIEKPNRRSSLVDYLPRATKVMFCSPVDTPIVVGQMRGKVIKSNLKGSDKSFVFDESVSAQSRPARKRSYTQSEAEAVSCKRKRLAGAPQHAAERLSRPRTASASGKLQDPGTPSKRASTSSKSRTEVTPSKSKPEGRILRTKLPNFTALHQKQFAKMESLDELQERKAKRARQLLTPTGPVNVLDRISPKENQPTPSPTEPQPQPKKTETPKKSIIPPEYQGYTRFGFKLKLDVPPYSFPSKIETKPKQAQESRIKQYKRQATLPSLTGATNLHKEAAKQTVLRGKSFTEKRDSLRNENRTIIKGVRTNRRFELQMKMRNVQ